MEVSSACYRGRSHLKNLGMSRSEQMITGKGKCCLNYPSGFYWGGGGRGKKINAKSVGVEVSSVGVLFSSMPSKTHVN